jgi:hypothetical protein
MEPERIHLGALATVLAWTSVIASPALAAVSVIANSTADPVELSVVVDDQPPRSLTVAAGESRPVSATNSLQAGLAGAPASEMQSIDPDCAYEVSVRKKDGVIRLARVPLGESPGRPWPPRRDSFAPPDAGVIKVKVLVDDDEKRNRATWEREIRARIALASDVLQAYAGVTLQIVAFDQWDSDDNTSDFSESLAEFEREVFPAPGQVAIGFSSQYQIFNGRVHFGGTRGAFHSHILIRERARNVLETERQELLVHELGHFLGATHSTDATSVMRPVVGQGLMRMAKSKLRFDAPNALLLAMTGQEINRRGVSKLGDISPDVRRRMTEIYQAMDERMPDDPSSGNFLRLLNSATVEPLIEKTRLVVGQIVAAAKRQAALRGNVESVIAGAGEAPLEGDKLLEYYVRQAALAAKQTGSEEGPRAFVLALGFAFDDSGTLQKLPVGASLAPHLESEQQRRERVAALGAPTMRGRADLTKHFFVSATLVPMLGSGPARSAGLVKEMLDANGGSGFSFRDMAANRAGIVFAHAVLGGRLALDDVAANFTVEAYLPPMDDLREDMQAAEFIREFGGVGDARVEDVLSGIETRILALPAYQNLRAPTTGK